MKKNFNKSEKSVKFTLIKCNNCDKEFPDDIQKALRSFKIKRTISCPNCNYTTIFTEL